MMAWVNQMDINLIFDGALVCAILGLWVMWFQQAGQRKKVEVMLQQAAADLQQASLLLEHVMQERDAGKETRREDEVAEREQHHASSKAMVEAIQKNISKQDKIHIQNKVHIQKRTQTQKKSSHTKVARRQVKDADAATKIRYLHQKGLDLKGISQKLGLPIAQVKLMLLLQKAQA